MGKRLAAVGMTAAIGLGGLGVAALNPLGVAGAQDGTTTEAPAAGTAAGTGAEHRDGPLARALDKLVADGTLTQAQADEVQAATKAEAEAGRKERAANRKDRRQQLLTTVADALGTTPEEVTAGLKGGTSIAKQAEAAGVERQVVDDAVTKLLTDRIDAAVADGHLTEERAAKAREHVDQAVDRILDADGTGGHGKGKGTLRDRIGHRRGN